MTGRLVYIIGPSGAGKDSVLAGLRSSWPATPSAHWSRRTITRETNDGTEAHEPVDVAQFERLRESGAFAMHWDANGLRYGIRHHEFSGIQAGGWVFANGSRAYLPHLVAHWPQALIVHIGASPAVLKRRLAARGREDPAAIAARLAREISIELPAGSIRIQNDDSLQEAVDTLREQLLAHHHRAAGNP
jgi:ribose 1,5-bisphosphokinase